MHGKLMSTIERRFEGARCAIGVEHVRAELAIGDDVFRIRAAMEPLGRVSIELPNTDGFELALKWTDRSRAGAREPTFDDSFLVETNDVGLAHAWLDRDSRDRLLASRYIAAKPPPTRATALLFRDGTWQHAVSNDEVTARCSRPEPSPDRVIDMLTTSLSLATVPQRWARAFVPAAIAVGGDLASRVEIAGRPIMRIRRGPVDVHVRLLRRFGRDDPGRLRTVISAHRHGSGGETLSLIADELPRAAWPPPNDLGGGSLRIDARARELLDAARPSTTLVRAHDVEITFDGVVSAAARLAPAIELAARWSGESAEAGPYR